MGVPFYQNVVAFLRSVANTFTALQTFSAGANISAPLTVNGSLVTNTLVQTVYTTYTSNASIATAIPSDDTIPQNTEGTQILSQAITPKKAGNILKVTVTGFAAINAAGQAITALFKDTDADALQAVSEYDSIANAQFKQEFVYYMTAPNTNSITFKVRSGPATAASIRWNGTAAGRLFGGVAAAYLIIEEFDA